MSIQESCAGLPEGYAPNELRRILSNLLNNAYEALHNDGKISILLSFSNNFIFISITDNGQGIPLDKMDVVLQGYSLKHAGKGIGLYSAKKYVESFSGGQLILNSEQYKGTEVTLKLPYFQKPDWFPENIYLKYQQMVVLSGILWQTSCLPFVHRPIFCE